MECTVSGARRRIRRWWAAAAAGSLLLSACSATAATTTTAASTTTTTILEADPLVLDGPGTYDGEVLSGGGIRRFTLYVPEEIASPAPLVLVFHGFTSNPDRVADLSGMSAVADREGFAVAYPAARGIPSAWRADTGRQGDTDVVFVRDLVEVIGEAIPIDDARVYAAGMSNGGGMAVRLGCEAADLVAAVAPVAGAMVVPVCDPVRPVPMIAFHGTEDRVVPYEGLGLLNLPDVEDLLAGWAVGNGCGPDPDAERVAGDVVRSTWGGCDAEVVLYTVEGGRHGWPGSERAIRELDSTRSIDASALIWEFFADHPMG
jgi:polyhydroxybutyrate depolymerase